LKNGGLEQLPNVGFIPNISFNVEKLVFHSFWNPNMHTHARVCSRMHEACVHKPWGCARICVYKCACPKASVTFLFQKKKKLILVQKRVIFFQKHFLQV